MLAQSGQGANALPHQRLLHIGILLYTQDHSPQTGFASYRLRRIGRQVLTEKKRPKKGHYRVAYLDWKLDLLLKRCGFNSRLAHLHALFIAIAGKNREYLRCVKRGDPIPLIECRINHADLAKKLGLRSSSHVCTLLRELRGLRLVDWKRGRDFNTYRIFQPDYEWIAAQPHKAAR